MSTLPFEAASRQWMRQINRKVPVADHPRDLVSLVSSVGDQVVTPIGRRYNARVTMGAPMRMKKGGKIHKKAHKKRSHGRKMPMMVKRALAGYRSMPVPYTSFARKQ